MGDAITRDRSLTAAVTTARTVTVAEAELLLLSWMRDADGPRVIIFQWKAFSRQDTFLSDTD